MFKDKRKRIPDDRDRNLKYLKLEDLPNGYPRASAYLNSDVGTTLFRRFGTLHSRALLYKQHELTELEAKLEKMDRDDAETVETSWRNSRSINRRDGEDNEDKKALIEEIVTKLEEYDDLLLRDAGLRKLTRPSKRSHRNFMDWVWTENPFGRVDQQFIFHQNDFVVLDEYDESWLDVFMHRLMYYFNRGFLRKVFSNAEDQGKTSDEQVRYYSEDRLGVFIKIFVAFTSSALLLIPIYLFLTCTISTKVMASITLVFALIFATAVTLCTNARRQDVFAATAAYCAVLVVFIGNIQQSQLPK